VHPSIIPTIILAGENGVGKTTIMDLFPGETILELDDDLNEIIIKSINFTNLETIEECKIREIDLDELVNNSRLYKDLLKTTEIILIVTNSAASNLGRTKKSLSLLKQKFPQADYYIIANFQDLEDSAFEPEEIEEFFEQKTYGFSAIQKDSKEEILKILTHVLNISVLEKVEVDSIVTDSDEITRQELKIFIKDQLNDNIEKARILGKQGEHIAASSEFSLAASQFQKLCESLKNQVERDEAEAVYYLCKAYESMELADGYEDSSKYSEAVELFTKASEIFTNTKFKLLALGNSAFCEALELGAEFDQSNEPEIKEKLYPKIKMILRKAANLYRKGGFESESDWVLAINIF